MFQIKMNIIITDCLFSSVGALNDCSQRFFQQASFVLSVCPTFSKSLLHTDLNFVTNTQYAIETSKKNQNVKI